MRGGAEYRLTATLTVSVENYQSGVYAFSATVTALVAAGVVESCFESGTSGRKSLTTLQAKAEDELTSELTFAHLGEGSTVTILSGGESFVAKCCGCGVGGCCFGGGDFGGVSGDDVVYRVGDGSAGFVVGVG